MKSKEVLALLRITRPTLCKYVKEDTINATLLPNGQYDYDAESVYAFLNKDIERKTVLYCRVSTNKQKQDLINQEEILKQYCFSNGIRVNQIYSDIASGINFENRTNFFNMLDEIIAGRVKRVIITYKDRLSRVGFSLSLIYLKI
jgi:predicted site-specific integrase-resolvase